MVRNISSLNLFGTQNVQGLAYGLKNVAGIKVNAEPKLHTNMAIDITKMADLIKSAQVLEGNQATSTAEDKLPEILKGDKLPILNKLIASLTKGEIDPRETGDIHKVYSDGEVHVYIGEHRSYPGEKVVIFEYKKKGGIEALVPFSFKTIDKMKGKQAA